MAEKANADSGGGGSPFSSSMNRIREAGKWLIAAAAAVGAAMIAGSQLSNIGSLAFCVPSMWSWTLGCLRLPVAVLGAAAALAAVAYILWQAVQLLLPVGVTLDDLVRQWKIDMPDGKRPSTHPRADVKFFADNPQQLPGRGAGARSVPEASHDFDEANELTRDAEHALKDAIDSKDKDAIAAAKAELTTRRSDAEKWQKAIGLMLSTAQYQLLEARFRGLLIPLLLATVVAAGGITTYAWASNPATPTTSLVDADLVGAVLKNAKLSGADLSRADLTDANLEGADLSGANLTDVVWKNTTCPDRQNSDQVDAARPTCLGHLNP